MSGIQKQYFLAKKEVESSMANVRTLRDQWRVASRENPTNMTKKEVDHIGKAFRNKLLTLKWDCEDLEELIGLWENEGNNVDMNELEGARQLIKDCRSEVSTLMAQMDESENSSKVFNKHGITLPTTTQTMVSTMMNSGGSKYERLSNNDAEEVQFDKNQVATSATVFNNVLYDHFEENDDSRGNKTFDNSQVFNNLSRPMTNVYMNPNENEIILDMLETEYYNPPSGLQNGSRLNFTLRKLLETDRNKFLGTLAFLFSFPILIVLFLVA